MDVILVPFAPLYSVWWLVTFEKIQGTSDDFVMTHEVYFK